MRYIFSCCILVLVLSSACATGSFGRVKYSSDSSLIKLLPRQVTKLIKQSDDVEIVRCSFRDGELLVATYETGKLTTNEQVDEDWDVQYFDGTTDWIPFFGFYSRANLSTASLRSSRTLIQAYFPHNINAYSRYEDMDVSSDYNACSASYGWSTLSRGTSNGVDYAGILLHENAQEIAVLLAKWYTDGFRNASGVLDTQDSRTQYQLSGKLNIPEEQEEVISELTRRVIGVIVALSKIDEVDDQGRRFAFVPPSLSWRMKRLVELYLTNQFIEKNIPGQMKGWQAAKASEIAESEKLMQIFAIPTTIVMKGLSGVHVAQ